MHVNWFQTAKKPRCNFGRALEQLFEKHKTHAHGFAPKIGMTYQGLYNYIWGVHYATPTFVYKISDRAGFTEEETQELLAAQAADDYKRHRLPVEHSHFGAVLVAKLAELGMTNEELKILTGGTNISGFITGKQTPTDSAIALISYTLELGEEEIAKLFEARRKDASNDARESSSQNAGKPG